MKSPHFVEMSRQGITLNEAQHEQLLLRLNPEELTQRFRKISESLSAPPNNAESMGAKVRSFNSLNSPSSDSILITNRAHSPMPFTRSLTAPISEFDAQSIRSYGSLASTADHSSPRSSRSGFLGSKKTKKSSLPAEINFMPIMSNAMSLATDQMGLDANLSGVKVVKSSDTAKNQKRKQSLFKRKQTEVDQPVELRFTFNRKSMDNMLREVEEVDGYDKKMIGHGNHGAPKLKNSTSVPEFSISVYDEGEDIRPVDPEGLIFGPMTTKNADNVSLHSKLDDDTRSYQGSHKISTTESISSQKTLTGSNDPYTLSNPSFEQLNEESTTDPQGPQLQVQPQMQQQRFIPNGRSRRSSSTQQQLEQQRRIHQQQLQQQQQFEQQQYYQQQQQQRHGQQMYPQLGQTKQRSVSEESPSSGFYSMAPSNTMKMSSIERKLSRMNELPSMSNLNPDQGFDTKSMISMRSGVRLSHQSEEMPRLGQSPEEKKQDRIQRFWDSFTMVGSIVYGISIFIIGIIVYMFDLFGKGSKRELSYAGEGFNMYLCIVGIVWLAWLMYDINKYITMMNEYYQNGGEESSSFKLVENEDGELIISIPLVTSKCAKLPQYYCFSSGRHSGSFYLKIGAAIFCMGHVIHMGIVLAKQISFFSARSDTDQFAPNGTNPDAVISCGNAAVLVNSILQALYVFLQLFMIFKFSNVIVNRSKRLARFAFMHCITSSLCFWVSTIVSETVDSVVKDAISVGDDEDYYSYYGLIEPKGKSCPDPYKACVLDPNQPVKFDLDLDCIIGVQCLCTRRNNFTSDLFDITPYFYPFSIEFSILVAGVWYVMWSNIGKVAEHKESVDLLPSPRRSIDSGTGKPLNDALYIYADCHAAIKGIFLGLLLLALGVIGSIVFSFLSPACNGKNYDASGCQAALVMNDAIESFILAAMIAATIWVYYSISQLDVNPNPISFLDDMLLFICLPSFFLYGILNLVSAIGAGNELTSSVPTNILMLLQVCLQTPMIVDGLRRCSDSRDNQTLKPGRNLVTFLLVANLTIYLWDTVEVKTSGYSKGRKGYYGDEFWTIVSHMTLPLTIFYRFHASVALADIWSSAYQPGSHH